MLYKKVTSQEQVRTTTEKSPPQSSENNKPNALDNPRPDNIIRQEAGFYTTDWQEQKTPELRLAKRIYDALVNGEKVKDNIAFRRLADLAFGGTLGSGAYDMSQAYDAMELGVNMYLAK